MVTKIRIYLIIALLGTIASLAFISYNRTVIPTAEGAGSDLLTIEIAATKTTYPLGEPIPLSIKLSNSTQLPISFNGVFNYVSENINVVSRTGSGLETRWIGAEHVLEFHGMPGRTLQPGESLQEKILFDEFYLTKFFPNPGLCQIGLEFIYQDYTSGKPERKTISSAPISIEIKGPAGPDRLAYEYLLGSLNPSVDDDDRDRELRSRQYFSDIFTGSVYWKYQVYALGVKYLNLKQYQKADDEFYKISDIDFYYSKEVENKLYQLNLNLHRPSIRTKRPPPIRIVEYPITITGPAEMLRPPPPLIPAPVPIKTPEIK